jgi:hypothetical protein
MNFWIGSCPSPSDKEVYDNDYYDKTTWEENPNNCNVLKVKYLSKMFQYWRK